MEKWNKIESTVEELIRSNCSINEFKAKVLTSAILDLLVQEGLVRKEIFKEVAQGKAPKDPM